ncbi:hypothetical protein SESBI_47384 [Sesbania bispinosa]|nr:hypothetical protein SESBI_47384 [Sesbania bispinosa]
METRQQSYLDVTEGKVAAMETKFEELVQSMTNMSLCFGGEKEDQDFLSMLVKVNHEIRSMLKKCLVQSDKTLNDDTELDKTSRIRVRGKDIHVGGRFMMKSLYGVRDDIHITTKRVKVPTFDGRDPRGCLTRVEQYSRLQRSPTKF